MEDKYDNSYTIVEEWERKRRERFQMEQKLIRRKLRIRMIAGMLAGVLLTVSIFSAGYLVRGSIFDILPDYSTVSSAPPPQSSIDSVTPAILPPMSEPEPLRDMPDNSAQKPLSDLADANQTRQSATASDLISLMIESATGADLTVSEIYNKVSPSIVGVRITYQFSMYSFGRFMMPDQEQSGEGSGIIISPDGYIMTNYHVVSSVIDMNTRAPVESSKIEVILPGDEDKTPLSAALVGYDVSTDLAVLKIDKTNLKAAEIGNSSDLVIGELAVAIGNPGGMEYMSSCTVGVISGLNRTIQTEGYRNVQLIQTDAAINPGNSGGALINSKGQVIGVNSIKIAASSFEGLGFAIPINMAIEICNDLIDYTYVKGRPHIGITAYSQYTDQLAERYNMPKGVYVYEIDEFGPAAKAGVKKNDIIVSLGGNDTPDFETLEQVKNKYKPNDEVDIRVYRDWSTNNYSGGQYVELRITLGEMRQ